MPRRHRCAEPRSALVVVESAYGEGLAKTRPSSLAGMGCPTRTCQRQHLSPEVCPTRWGGSHSQFVSACHDDITIASFGQSDSYHKPPHQSSGHIAQAEPASLRSLDDMYAVIGHKLAGLKRTGGRPGHPQVSERRLAARRPWLLEQGGWTPASSAGKEAQKPCRPACRATLGGRPGSQTGRGKGPSICLPCSRSRRLRMGDEGMAANEVHPAFQKELPMVPTPLLTPHTGARVVGCFVRAIPSCCPRRLPSPPMRRSEGRSVWRNMIVNDVNVGTMPHPWRGGGVVGRRVVRCR